MSEKEKNVNVSSDTVQLVWERAGKENGIDPFRWRKDECGAWICRDSYGTCDSKYGWEIVKINSRTGEEADNLKPLQWENASAVEKTEGKCIVSSCGAENIKIG